MALTRTQQQAVVARDFRKACQRATDRALADAAGTVLALLGVSYQFVGDQRSRDDIIRAAETIGLASELRIILASQGVTP